MKAPAWVRGVIDLLLIVVFIIVVLSRIALHLAPSGEMAETIGWTFLGLSKDTWENLRTYLGFVMIGLIVVHIVLGFNSMVAMLKSAFKRKKAKVIGGLAVMTLVLIGGYFAFEKITGKERTIIKTTSGKYITTDSTTIEITGAMLKSFTLEQLAEAYNVDVQKLVEILKTDYGIEAKPNELLETIEINNGFNRRQFKEVLSEAIQKAKGD